MKILYVHETYGPLGGAEANVLKTAAALKSIGFQVSILSQSISSRSLKQWDEVFERPWILSQSESTSVIRSQVLQLRPDVVYIHKCSRLDILEGILCSGVPSVRMVHDHDMYCMRSYRYNPLTRKPCSKPFSPACVVPCLGNFVRSKDKNSWVPIRYQSYKDKKSELELSRLSNMFFVVTHYMRQQLILNGFEPSQIHIMPPVPENQDAPGTHEQSSDNIILYAGQIIRGKGVDYLIKSLRYLQGPFQVIIAGDGSHKNYCQQLTRKYGLDKRVQFVGFIPQEELKKHLTQARVAVVSSVWPEPIATIGLEVMRYGIPVVGFNSGGISDWLHDGVNGFLVPVFNERIMAEKIQWILDHPLEAGAMGEAGREYVNEKYNFSAYINQMVLHFKSLAQQHHPVNCLHQTVANGCH